MDELKLGLGVKQVKREEHPKKRIESVSSEQRSLEISV